MEFLNWHFKDEGPSHEEVQYYWTERHIARQKVATPVTTRSSGASYLNRVELQNGCLSLGHANTFIPSTLGGGCGDPATGNIDAEKVKANINLAIEAYISRVDVEIHKYICILALKLQKSMPFDLTCLSFLRAQRRLELKASNPSTAIQAKLVFSHYGVS